MESIGEILREARHRKQVTLEDVSRVTKIKVAILEQLEADEFDRLVSPTYTKGFLKLYAEYLGLDSQELIAAYLRLQGGLHRKGLRVETAVSARRHRPELRLPARQLVWLVAGLTLVVAALVIGKWWWTGEPSSSPPAARPVAEVPTVNFEALYQPKPAPPALLELPQ
jgi:cytoskeletal protein RodZ